MVSNAMNSTLGTIHALQSIPFEIAIWIYDDFENLKIFKNEFATRRIVG